MGSNVSNYTQEHLIFTRCTTIAIVKIRKQTKHWHCHPKSLFLKLDLFLRWFQVIPRSMFLNISFVMLICITSIVGKNYVVKWLFKPLLTLLLLPPTSQQSTDQLTSSNGPILRQPPNNWLPPPNEIFFLLKTSLYFLF